MYMDIDLLSRMVKELLLDKDEVRLPGVGTFVAEIVPSSFSDKGFTINPPYRKISFRQNLDGDDDSLVREYADAAGIPESDARRVLSAFLEEMKEVLKEKKTIIFPALGRLRATKENNFFFVADENLDIYPDGFGLEPISLKSHEESPAEVSATVAGLADMIIPARGSDMAAEEHPTGDEDPVPAPEEVPQEKIAVAEVPEEATEADSTKADGTGEALVPEEIPVADTEEAAAEDTSATGAGEEATGPETVTTAIAETPSQSSQGESQSNSQDESNNKSQSQPDKESKVESQNKPTTNSENRKSRLPFILAACLIIVILTVLAFLLIARFAPDFIDRLLYNKEDLELVRQLF